MHTTDEGLAVGLPCNNDGGGTLLPNVFFVTSNKIFKSRIPVGKGRCFRSDHAWPWLIPFATVPRSGTTFLRRVFEVATGLATEIEYWESGSCKRMLNAPFLFILYTDCIDGWARPKQVKHNFSGFHCCAHGYHVPGALIIVRNPLTYFDAFRRYLSDKEETIKFRDLAQKWAEQYTAWEELSNKTGLPRLSVRDEDLMHHPYIIFQQLFVNLGLDEDLRISADQVRKAVDFAIEQHKNLEIFNPTNKCVEIEGKKRSFGIPEYANVETCGPNVDEDDLIWLHKWYHNLLMKLGYEIPLIDLDRSLNCPGGACPT